MSEHYDAEDSRPDDSAGAVIVRLSERYGLTPEQTAAFIDDVVAELPGEREPLADLRKMEAKMREAWHNLINYQSNQTSAKVLKMSTRAMALELGYVNAAGAESTSELSRRSGVGKATVNVCANTFRWELKLPTAPGQRSDEGKNNMRDSRKKQLRKQ